MSVGADKHACNTTLRTRIAALPMPAHAHRFRHPDGPED